MPNETDSLTALRDAVGGILSNNTAFSDAPAVLVINEDAGDLVQAITTHLKQKTGVLCVVPSPTLAPGDYTLTLKARVRVDLFENVLLNRKGAGFKTAPGLLICTLNLLRNKPTGSNEWKDLVFVDHIFEVKGTSVHHTLLFDADLLC